ncbi:MAG: lipoyl domain-containing protein [Chloroflexi bacterium]|nr:lipoyl domain-containing protein [Chloroflexota bacterium]
MGINVLVKLANLHPRMEHNTLVSWLKREGDSVRKGEPLYLVETRKGVFEVCSEVEGTVQRLFVAEKALVKVDQEIATIMRCDQ